MSGVEYEIGCALHRIPLVLHDGEGWCERCMAHPTITGVIKQTGCKRRRQFIAWPRSRRFSSSLLKPVPFR